jgi:hypothetical protein
MKIKYGSDIPFGSHRAREGFLFLPKYIDGEVRWLEYAYWEDIRTSVGWAAWEWLCEDEYESLKNRRWYRRDSSGRLNL